MAEQKEKGKVLGLIAPYMVTALSASSLAVFSDRITMGPDRAGFWMVLALGMSLGASIVATAVYFGAKKTPSA